MSSLIISYVWNWHLRYIRECTFSQQMWKYLAVYKLLSNESSMVLCVYVCARTRAKKKVKA